MVSGRNVLAVNLVTGTQSGELAMPGMPAVPPSGKKIGMFMFHKLAINDANKATEEWGFDDPGTMMGQLGLAPKDAPPTRAAVDKGIEGAPIVVITADDAKEKANIDVTKKGYEAFSAHKMPDLMATMTDDTVDSDQASPADVTGKKNVEKFLGMWLAGFSDAKANISEYYAAGDYVVSIGKFEGTHDHDFGKIKKTGKKVSLDFAEVGLMKDGKLARAWRFHSGMQFAMQLGLMPAPGASAAGSAAPAGGAAPAAGSAAPAAGSAAPATK
jgi:predicted ester cyclase